MNRKEISIAIATVLLLLLRGTAPVSAQISNIGVRTNIAAWAVASPSLGVDVQWNQRWQATLDGHISLLSDDPDNGHARYLRASGAGAEVRRYFKAEQRSSGTLGRGTSGKILDMETLGSTLPFRGVYMGLGARYLKFDHLRGGSIGREGVAYTAGVIAGYTFRLPARLTVDVAVGAGYRYKNYNRYEWYQPANQNRFLNEKSNHSFGITHAEVSLVYHFKF